MKQLKLGISLIALGNLLYLMYIFFAKGDSSNFGDFTNGLLLGLSIGTNLVGIVLSGIYISKNNKNNK